MELTVQNVYGLLLRSKLLPVDEAKEMYARWQKEAGEGSTNLSRFAEWMVANRLLTTYQANLLARGHAEGFFIEEYKILDRLGKGRMAGVYKARHPLGQTVAIKVLPPSRARDPELLGRFLREGRLAAKLKHPNIVRTFLLARSGDIHYLVMEHLEGETLEELVARRGPLPPTEGVRLIYQAFQGLQHIHSQGLVHRDLKPSNIMIVNGSPESAAQATLKILDIGLGRSLFDEGKLDKLSDPELTTQGAMLGTPDYMAPEQARNPRSADIRADIYSLGCVLYYILTGKPPFPDTNLISQMIRHATEPPPLLKDSNPAVPDGLQQITAWMLAKDPAQRYPSPERAAQALQVFLAGATGPLIEPESDPSMQSFLALIKEREPKKPLTVVEIQTDGEQPKAIPPKAKVDGSAVPSKEIREKKKSSIPHPALAGATSKPAQSSTKQPDVELIAASSNRVGKPDAQQTLALSRRDLILFGIGVATGAGAAMVGCLVALRNRVP